MWRMTDRLAPFEALTRKALLRCDPDFASGTRLLTILVFDIMVIMVGLVVAVIATSQESECV